MSFWIATDSTADLPADFIEKFNLRVFGLSYNINGKTYGRGEELDPSLFYSSMREGQNPITSQVNPDDVRTGFEKMVQECSDILFISFSSGLSGTYNSVRLAAMDVMEEYPDARIEVFDSLSASMGEGLLVYKAVMEREKGKNFNEVCSFVEKSIPNLVHLFTVDDLNHLYRGGRVSKSSALIGSVLNIKPILNVDSQGHLTCIGKVRGRKKAFSTMVEMMADKIGNKLKENDIFFVSHADALDDAKEMVELVKERFHIDDYMINFIGPTIGSHAGPGTVALFFMGDSR